MPALILYRDGTGGAEAYPRECAPLRAVYVPRGEGLRARFAARSAARALSRAGVRYAVFPPDYPHREIFARCGVATPPLAPLYRATALAIVRRCLEQMGVEARSAEVVLAARQTSPELRAFAFALSAEVRYLSLAVPRGGEALARELLRLRGVAPRFRPDLTVSFDGSDAGEGALRLDEGLSVRYESEPPNEALAALFLAGALDAAALRVREVPMNNCQRN